MPPPRLFAPVWRAGRGARGVELEQGANRSAGRRASEGRQRKGERKSEMAMKDRGRNGEAKGQGGEARRKPAGEREKRLLGRVMMGIKVKKKKNKKKNTATGRMPRAKGGGPRAKACGTDQRLSQPLGKREETRMDEGEHVWRTASGPRQRLRPTSRPPPASSCPGAASWAVIVGLSFRLAALSTAAGFPPPIRARSTAQTVDSELLSFIHIQHTHTRTRTSPGLFSTAVARPCAPPIARRLLSSSSSHQAAGRGRGQSPYVATMPSQLVYYPFLAPLLPP